MVRGMPMENARRFDRTSEDVGNIVKLEHVNVTVPDQGLATLFYISGLGLTRDPYLMTGVDNMWVNAGENQFHLPTGEPQRLRGTVGLVLPDLAALAARLRAVEPSLRGTRFSFEANDTFVDTTCPWGNRIRCHAPEPARFGARTLGMAYVELDVAPGTAAGIASFYRDVLAAHARVENATAIVTAGARQWLRFRETDASIAPYDGHHIQVYIADFSGPWKRLRARGLVSMETDEHEYRFIRIAGEPGSTLFELEHEVRSLRHPLYGRPLVNRNPAQSNRGYMPGRDAFG
jgi:hypothetical protein